MYGENVGDHDTGQHKKGIQGAVGNIDVVKSVRGGHPLNVLVEEAVPIEENRRQYEEVDRAKGVQQFFRRRRIAVAVGKPAVTQRDKGGAHIFHRHRCHSSLQGGGGQLQQIACVLHQRAAHDENKELLLPGSVSADQEEQGRKGQAYPQAFQCNDKVYHFPFTCPSLLFHAEKKTRGSFSLNTIIHFHYVVKKYSRLFLKKTAAFSTRKDGNLF